MEKRKRVNHIRVPSGTPSWLAAAISAPLSCEKKDCKYCALNKR